jgi:hypothetical protein
MTDDTAISRDGLGRGSAGAAAVRGVTRVLIETREPAEGLGARTGNVSGYGSELNVLCGIGDISSPSHGPLTKHQMMTVVQAGT